MYKLEYMYQCIRTVSFEAKKGFPFISLRSENNFIQFIEAKRKIGSEKKRKKNRTDD
jgi:hypothetical protein